MFESVAARQSKQESPPKKEEKKRLAHASTGTRRQHKYLFTSGSNSDSEPKNKAAVILPKQHTTQPAQGNELRKELQATKLVNRYTQRKEVSMALPPALGAL